MLKSLSLSHKILFFILLMVAFFLRFYHPSSELPNQLSWSNAATQDATWYTAVAVHKALGMDLPFDANTANVDRFLFTWYATIVYQIFGVSYNTNTLISAIPGVASVALLFYLMFLYMGRLAHSERIQCALVSALLLCCNYTHIAFSRTPVLYLPITFYMLFVVFIWMLAIKRPWLFFLPWLMVALGFWGLKVIVALIALPLFVGHLLLAKKNKSHVKPLFVGLFVCLMGLVFLYFQGYFSIAYAKIISKFVRKPLTWEESFQIYLRCGFSSRFFVRNPILSIGAFLFPVFFLLDQRKLSERILEVIFLLWFLILLAGCLPQKEIPLRFLSMLILPMTALWGLLLEKIIYFVPKRPTNFFAHRSRRWRYRNKKIKNRNVFQNLSNWRVFGILIWGILGATFCFHHMITEIHRNFVGIAFWNPNVPLIWKQIREDFFLFHGLLAFGISMMLASFWILLKETFFFPKMKWGRTILGVGLLVSVGWNISQSFDMLNHPQYTQYYFSKEMPSIIGKKAHLTGPYAHALTLETSLKRSFVFRLNLGEPSFDLSRKFLQRNFNSSLDPFALLTKNASTSLLTFDPKFRESLKKRKATHLAIPRFSPDSKIIEAFFDQANIPLYKIREIYLRGWKVMVYRICWKQTEPIRVFLEIKKLYEVLQESFLLEGELQKKLGTPLLDPLFLVNRNWRLFLNIWSVEQKIEVIQQGLKSNVAFLLKNIPKASYSSFEKGIVLFHTTEIFEKINRQLTLHGLSPILKKKEKKEILNRATAFFSKTSKDFPLSSFPVACQAFICLKLNNWTKSEKLFEKAIHLNPRDGKTWEMFSSFYSKRSDCQNKKEKIQDLLKALSCQKKAYQIYPSGKYLERRAKGLYFEIQRLRKKR